MQYVMAFIYYYVSQFHWQTFSCSYLIFFRQSWVGEICSYIGHLALSINLYYNCSSLEKTSKNKLFLTKFLTQDDNNLSAILQMVISKKKFKFWGKPIMTSARGLNKSLKQSYLSFLQCRDCIVINISYISFGCISITLWTL